MKRRNTFTRGGVYRVVKEAMGGTLAKLSVSALMFDYILTGPISGVSAGLYLAGLVNEAAQQFGLAVRLPMNGAAMMFALAVTLYFWRRNIKGLHESSVDALLIMYIATLMIVILIVWSGLTLAEQGGQLAPSTSAVIRRASSSHDCCASCSTGRKSSIIPIKWRSTWPCINRARSARGGASRITSPDRGMRFASTSLLPWDWNYKFKGGTLWR